MRVLKINVLFLILFSLLGCSEQTQVPKNSNSGYISVDQGKLFYQKFGSGGIPIIVLHGLPGFDQTYLQPQMLELAKNQEVIFYDQRGAGKSLETTLAPEQINLEQFTKDLEELRKQLNLNKFVLLGHSWGGLLAMNYSITHPDRIAGLILLSAAPADYPGQQAFIGEFAKKTVLIKNQTDPLFHYQAFQKLDSSQISKLYGVLFSVYFFDSQKASQLNLNMDKTSAISAEKVGEIMIKTSWLNPNLNLFPQLEQLKVPTMVIHGEQDIFPLWIAQKIKNTIPNAQMLTLEGCGHFPFIEKKEQLFDQINLFLTNISKL